MRHEHEEEEGDRGRYPFGTPLSRPDAGCGFWGAGAGLLERAAGVGGGATVHPENPIVAGHTDAKFVDEVIDMFQRYLGKDPG